MKVKRVRRVKKILNFYKNHFGFAPPYRILIDGTFAHRALKAKVNIADELPKYLYVPGWRNDAAADIKRDTFNPDRCFQPFVRMAAATTDSISSSSSSPHCEILTTDCCLKELECLGSQLYGALCVLRQYAVKPCGHVDPVPPIHCLLSILKKGNPGKFILASMDNELKLKAQNIAEVPIVYLNGSTPILDKPTEKAVDQAESGAKNAVEDVEGIHVLKQIKREMALKESAGKDSIRKVGRKKKAKGPNPLSMKKKKTVKKKK